MKKNYLEAFLCAFFLGITLLQGQQITEIGSYFSWFDSRVGIENTALYEGILYKELYRTINEKTQFFKSPDFLPGSVMYKGQPYVDLQLKYNVYDDQLLVKVDNRLGGNTLQLFRDEISEFTLDGALFTHIVGEPVETGIGGFYEVSLEYPTFQLLTKYSKKLFKRKDRSSLYYEFLEGNEAHVLHYGNQYYPLNRKRDVTELFPDLEKQINDFYNRAMALRRSDSHAFTVALLKRIGSLLPQQKSNAFR